MKFSPLLLLALTTTTTVVGTATEVQASSVTRRSEAAMTEIYRRSGMDRAHWDLLVAVTKKGITVKVDTPSCKETGFDAYYWSSQKEMVFCSSLTGASKSVYQSVIRHEVGHMVQDLKAGGVGNGRLTPHYNTKSGDFWSFYKSSNRIDHSYVETYNKGGSREDLVTYHLEADAEVQQTESAQTLKARLFSF